MTYYYKVYSKYNTLIIYIINDVLLSLPHIKRERVFE